MAPTLRRRAAQTPAGSRGAWNTQSTQNEFDAWRAQMSGVVLSSDAFFPFRDNIDCAARVSASSNRRDTSTQYGVDVVCSPGGSTNDDSIVRACNEHGMTLVHTGLRLFHH